MNRKMNKPPEGINRDKHKHNKCWRWFIMDVAIMGAGMSGLSCAKGSNPNYENNEYI